MISQLQKFTPGQADPLALLVPARTGRVHFVRFHAASGAVIGCPDDTIRLVWRPAWALDCERERERPPTTRPLENLTRNYPLRGSWSPTFTTNGAQSLPAASYDLDLAPFWAPTAGSLYLAGGTPTGDPAAVLYVSMEHRPIGLGEQPPRRARTLWGAAATPVPSPRGAYAVTLPDTAEITLTYPPILPGPGPLTRTVTPVAGSVVRLNGAASVTRTATAGPIRFEVGL